MVNHCTFNVDLLVFFHFETSNFSTQIPTLSTKANQLVLTTFPYEKLSNLFQFYCVILGTISSQKNWTFCVPRPDFAQYAFNLMWPSYSLDAGAAIQHTWAYNNHHAYEDTKAAICDLDGCQLLTGTEPLATGFDTYDSCDNFDPVSFVFF